MSGTPTRFERTTRETSISGSIDLRASAQSSTLWWSSTCRSPSQLSGRPASVVELGLRREAIGGVACENLAHFFRSLAVSMRAAVHVDVLRGENDHHRAEAAFKGFAMALRQAVAPDGDGVPSTKGTL